MHVHAHSTTAHSIQEEDASCETEDCEKPAKLRETPKSKPEDDKVLEPRATRSNKRGLEEDEKDEESVVLVGKRLRKKRFPKTTSAMKMCQRRKVPRPP